MLPLWHDHKTIQALRRRRTEGDQRCSIHANERLLEIQIGLDLVTFIWQKKEYQHIQENQIGHMDLLYNMDVDKLRANNLARTHGAWKIGWWMHGSTHQVKRKAAILKVFQGTLINLGRARELSLEVGFRAPRTSMTAQYAFHPAIWGWNGTRQDPDCLQFSSYGPNSFKSASFWTNKQWLKIRVRYFVSKRNLVLGLFW